jgi:hypothetical protein
MLLPVLPPEGRFDLNAHGIEGHRAQDEAEPLLAGHLQLIAIPACQKPFCQRDGGPGRGELDQHVHARGATTWPRQGRPASLEQLHGGNTDGTRGER